MAGGEPRLGTTATYMRRDNQRSAIPCQSEIAMLHDRNHGEYQAFSAASLKTWSKFGLKDHWQCQTEMPVPCMRPPSRPDCCAADHRGCRLAVLPNTGSPSTTPDRWEIGSCQVVRHCSG